jgi:hypothetical protein
MASSSPKPDVGLVLNVSDIPSVDSVISWLAADWSMSMNSASAQHLGGIRVFFQDKYS